VEKLRSFNVLSDVIIFEIFEYMNIDELDKFDTTRNCSLDVSFW